MVSTITLPLAAVDILAEQLKLDVRQYPFDIPRFGETPEERARIAHQVRADMERFGLASAGRPEPEVEDALYLLCSSEVSVSAAGLLDVRSGRQLAARVVATGEVGVVGVLEGQSLRMTFMCPDDLPGACADLLPDAPPGAGRPVSIPRTRGGRHGRSEPAGEPDEQIRAAEAITARPKFGVGHYVITSTDRRGRRARLPALGWLDTDRGRYTVLGERSPDGYEVITYAPAGKEQIAVRIGELLARVRPGEPN